MKKICMFSIVVIVLYTSCSSNLSREKALTQIRQSYNGPHVEYEIIQPQRTINDGNESDGYKRLEKQGLIQLIPQKTYTNFWGITEIEYAVQVTPTGLTYSIPESSWTQEMQNRTGGGTYTIVKVCAIDVGEITGIQQDEHQAKVQYTLKVVDETPFIDVFYTRKNGYFGTYNVKQSKSFNQVATFSKYDDGWRL